MSNGIMVRERDLLGFRLPLLYHEEVNYDTNN